MNKCWRSLLCTIVVGAAAPLIVFGQENNDQAKPTPPKRAFHRKSAKVDTDKGQPANGARKENYVSSMLEKGYQPLTSLDGNTNGTNKTFTLGAIPQSSTPNVYNFTEPDAKALDQRISHDDELIASGKANAGIYADRACLKAAQGNLTAAVTDCDRAIEMDPSVSTMLGHKAAYFHRIQTRQRRIKDLGALRQ